MFKKVIYNFCVLRNKVIDKDDFAWKRYHKNYHNQIKKSEETSTLKLSDDFEIIEGDLKFNCNPPLLDNHELIYKIIYDLFPSSISEVGCGCGDHLFNLQRIMPNAKINGCDLLQKQLDLLNERNPELKDKTLVNDITKKTIPKSDLVFTQAVIMHIQKGKRHINALINLIESSSKYVVLMENWSRHNFVEDIKGISKGLKTLGLEEKIYLYKVDNGKQIAIVISKIPINNKKLNYVELTNNEEMLKYL